MPPKTAPAPQPGLPLATAGRDMPSSATHHGVHLPIGTQLPVTIPVAEAIAAQKSGQAIPTQAPDPAPREDAKHEQDDRRPDPASDSGQSGDPNAPAEQPTEPQPTPPPQRAPEQDQKPAAAMVKRDPLPFYPTNTDEMWRYATMLANSDLLPRGLKDKQTGKGIVANIHLVLMKGHDFGLKPMQSIASINVIDGKAEVGALMMVSLIRKSGLCASWRLVESTDRRAIFSTRRVGDLEDTVFEYTIEEADQMGLLDKGKSDWAKENNQWKRQPRTMLRRRCQSMLGREVYSDVVLGLYDHDELSEMREVAERLGLREDQIANAIDVTSTPAVAALPEGSDGPIKRIDRARYEQAGEAQADPVKARLAARREASGGIVPRCSECGSPRDPRDSDPCIACRPTEDRP